MKNKVRVNPILKKDIMVSSRNKKMTISITIINIILLAIVAFVLLVMGENYTGTSFYTLIAAIYPAVAAFEMVVIVLVIPIMTSSAISGERERQTLDIMLTTPIKPMNIVLGKLYSALTTVLMYVMTSIPFMAIAFVIGGLKFYVLFEYIVMMLLLGIYVGSIGIYSSSVKRNSVSATITSIVIIAAIAIITLIIFYIGYFYYNYGGEKTGDVDFMNITSLALAFNPFAGCVDFMMRSCDSENIYTYMSYMLPQSRLTGFLPWFLNHIIPICVIVNLLVAYAFLRLAAYRTVVTRNKRKRKSKR